MSIPYMPIYWGDYLGDTQHLTAIEHGGYLLLISHYWRTGSIPNDDVKLSRISRMTMKQWNNHGPTIMEFFPDGKHKRIDRELSKIVLKSEKMRLASEKRWNTNEDAKSLKSLDADDACALPEQSISNANQNQNHNHIKEEDNHYKQTALATRLPNDWNPSNEDIEFANHTGVDWIKNAEIFRDYCVAQPGVKGRKANWSATWRNWIRRASEQKIRPSQSKETAIEMGRRLIMEFENDEQNTSITGSIANVISLPRQQG